MKFKEIFASVGEKLDDAVESGKKKLEEFNKIPAQTKIAIFIVLGIPLGAGLSLYSSGAFEEKDKEDRPKGERIGEISSKADDTPVTNKIATVDKTPPNFETSPGYKNAIETYKSILGPGKTSKGYYYIDLTDNFASYGPFDEDTGQSRDKFHDNNRKKIKEENQGVYVDLKRDVPVPGVFGLKDQSFETKYKNSQQEYDGGKLIEKVLESFNSYYADSKLKKFLAEADADEEFRDYVIYGLVGVESAWEINSRTYAGKKEGYAKGLFQAIDGTNNMLVKTGYLDEVADPDLPEEAAKYAVAMLEFHLDYLKEKVGDDSIIFKGENRRTVLVPLLLTSFNQGNGRLARIGAYLEELHEAELIPDEYYKDKENEIFNEEAVVYLWSRAFTVVKTDKMKKKMKAPDKKFKKNNGGFGKDGAQYALKIMALADLFHPSEKKLEKNLDARKFASREGNARFDQARLNRVIKRDPARKYSSERFKRDEIIAEADFDDNQKKLIIFDHEQVKQPERRAIPKNTISSYMEFAEKVLEKTGKVPEINSTCRADIPENGSKTSFHLNCMGVDIDVRNYHDPKSGKMKSGLAKEDMDTMLEILMEMSMDGKLAVRHESPGKKWEHIHIVLIPPDQQEAFKEYVNGGNFVSKKAEPKTETEPVSSYRVKDPSKHCREAYKRRSKKHSQCVKMVSRINVEEGAAEVPRIRGEVFRSIFPELGEQALVAGQTVEVDPENNKNLTSR